MSTVFGVGQGAQVMLTREELTVALAATFIEGARAASHDVVNPQNISDVALTFGRVAMEVIFDGETDSSPEPAGE